MNNFCLKRVTNISEFNEVDFNMNYQKKKYKKSFDKNKKKIVGNISFFLIVYFTYVRAIILVYVIKIIC